MCAWMCPLHSNVFGSWMHHTGGLSIRVKGEQKSEKGSIDFCQVDFMTFPFKAACNLYLIVPGNRRAVVCFSRKRKASHSVPLSMYACAGAEKLLLGNLKQNKAPQWDRFFLHPQIIH